jgi:hypothetical protein
MVGGWGMMCVDVSWVYQVIQISGWLAFGVLCLVFIERVSRLN